MINKTTIESLVQEHISDKEIFLVSVNVSTGNKITILVNRKSGITIDECVKLSRHIESSLDREKEDFELQVSSPGVGEPLLVDEQYEMNIGRKVEVIDEDGKKHSGILKSFADKQIIVETKVKGKAKKKEQVEKPFKIEEIRSVKVLVTFKK